MHTFFFLDDQKVETIRTRASSDPATGQGLSEIEREADLYVAECATLADLPSGKQAGYGFTRPFDRMLTVLGFLARLRGDCRYAGAALTVMEFLGRSETWEGRWTDRVPNWRATLATSANAQAFSLALNWLGDTLPVSERERHARILFEKGIRPLMEDWIWPGARIHSLDSMGHNFWSYSVAGAGVAALASMQYCEDARSCVADVHASLVEWFDYPGNTLQNKVPNFGSDGGYYEGLSYSLNIRTILQFAEAYHTFFEESPLESVPQLAGLLEFYLHGSYESSNGLLSLNFGDHVTTDWPGKIGPLFQSMLLRLATLLHDGRAQWLADRVSAYGPEPFGLIWHDDAIAPVAPDDLPLCRQFKGIGWAVCRDSWRKDSTLFAIKSGTTWNHTHADAASFVLWAYGEPLIVDSGSLNYPRREYINYFCQPAGHNVVLVDGHSQPIEDIYRGCGTVGAIPVLVDALGYKYVLADATGPTSGVFQRNFRHVIWVDGSFVVMDDLLSHRPGVFEWLFHPAGEVEIPGGPMVAGQVRRFVRSESTGASIEIDPAVGPAATCGLEVATSASDAPAARDATAGSSAPGASAPGTAVRGAPAFGVPFIDVRKGRSCVQLSCVWPAEFECEAREGVVEQDRGLSPDIPPSRTTYYVLKARAADRTRVAGELAFKVDGVESELDATGREQKFVVVLTPYLAGQESILPSVTPLECDNLKGVRLGRGSCSVDVIFNLLADGRVMHHNSINTYGLIETDASIITVCRDSGRRDGWPDHITGLRMHNGSILRMGGRSVIETALKADFVVDRLQRGFRVHISSRAGFGVSVGCPKKPAAVSAAMADTQPDVIRFDLARGVLNLRLVADVTDLSIDW